jgi:hypothetical protein
MAKDLDLPTNQGGSVTASENKPPSLLNADGLKITAHSIDKSLSLEYFLWLLFFTELLCNAVFWAALDDFTENSRRSFSIFC